MYVSVRPHWQEGACKQSAGKAVSGQIVSLQAVASAGRKTGGRYGMPVGAEAVAPTITYIACDVSYGHYLRASSLVTDAGGKTAR